MVFFGLGLGGRGWVRARARVRVRVRASLTLTPVGGERPGAAGEADTALGGLARLRSA